MHLLGYHWVVKFTGQNTNGHGRPDIVDYQNQVFLPAINALHPHLRVWNEALTEEANPNSSGQHIVLWFHDKSIFYANDRRLSCWVHKTQSATPYTKEEGRSLMIAHFISVDYGYLTSPDGKETALQVFCPGKIVMGISPMHQW
jgi:hypothetical protein